MSAFIVSKECMDRAVAGLVSLQTRELAGVDVLGAPDRQLALTDIGRKLFAMNVRAVNGRYPNHSPQSTPDYAYQGPTHATEHVPADVLVLRYKALQCLVYQCSEDATIGDPYLGELNTSANRLAARIVSMLPAYNKAPWS
jgi:hypothetical protein